MVALVLTVDQERAPATALCANCDGSCVVTTAGRCEACGSESVIRPFSLATRLAKARLVLDPAFYRGERWTA